MQDKSNTDSLFWGDFPSDLIPKATEDINPYFSLFTVTIPVNYTSYFWEFFEANTYLSVFL